MVDPYLDKIELVDLDLDLGMLALDDIIYVLKRFNPILLICSGFNWVCGLSSGSRKAR